MSKYKNYFLHDPIGNYESQLTNFDQDAIQQAMDQGYVIIGVTHDDTREIVRNSKDVVVPDVATFEGFSIVLPSYVDSRIDALAEVIENLVESLSTQMDEKKLLQIKNSVRVIRMDAEKVIESDRVTMEHMEGVKNDGGISL